MGGNSPRFDNALDDPVRDRNFAVPTKDATEGQYHGDYRRTGSEITASISHSYRR